MWFRCLVVASLFTIGCGGSAPPAAEEPTAPAADEPPPAPADPPPAVEPDLDPEPESEPELPPSKPEPPPERVCSELAASTCKVTEGCEWHSMKGCLEQEKPKTLGD